MKENRYYPVKKAAEVRFMKKSLFLVAFLAALLLAVSVSAGTEEDPAEWTVMFYLCGSDLESKYSYATGNLEEITGCFPYQAALDRYASMNADKLDDPESRRPGNVNVVFETGGCKEWHAQEYCSGISADRLQRWHLETKQDLEFQDYHPLILDEELELTSMADPETLSDFIRWGTVNYPAKKYALVLWDHGGGSKTGLFIDELFDGDTLYLDELHTAMQDGGVTFETVLFDACMMANLETAYAIKDNANWMVASEEVVAGKGTAMGKWLQQLFDTPDCDGERLGRWICDMTQIKYADEDDEQTQSILTWSVIDLSKIDTLTKTFDRFFEAIGDCYANRPLLMSIYAKLLQEAEEYGLGQDNMYDLSTFFYDEGIRSFLDINLYEDMLDALANAVVYCVRGTGRSQARGIAYCYAPDFDASELDIYARNCPSAHYLAFLDAINPGWTAPDRVYQTVDRLPDIRDIEDYQIRVEKRIGPDGTPGVFDGGLSSAFVSGFYADLYRLNEETGETVSMGTTMAYMEYNAEESGAFYYVYEPWKWPAVEKVPCNISLIAANMTKLQFLFNIPVRIGTDNWILRCVYDDNSEEYVIDGVWEGYDMDSGIFNRNVKSLSQLAGQEFSLLYPIEGTQWTDHTRYESSEPLTMYRSLEIKEHPLPEGTYYLDYWTRDLFMRHLPIGRVEMQWDGEAMTMSSDESWEGTMTLEIPEE